jgi:hypothetical protein
MFEPRFMDQRIVTRMELRPKQTSRVAERINFRKTSDAPRLRLKAFIDDKQEGKGFPMTN